MRNFHRNETSLSVICAKRSANATKANERREERTARYMDLAENSEYGDNALPRYDEDLWFDEAVNEDVRGLRDRGDSALLRFDPLTDKYSWKHRKTYEQTDWYLFQQAVKAHQDETWDILAASNLRGLDLEAL